MGLGLFILLLMFSLGIVLASNLVKKTSTPIYFAFLFSYCGLMILISSLFV